MESDGSDSDTVNAGIGLSQRKRISTLDFFTSVSRLQKSESGEHSQEFDSQSSFRSGFDGLGSQESRATSIADAPKAKAPKTQKTPKKVTQKPRRNFVRMDLKRKFRSPKSKNSSKKYRFYERMKEKRELISEKEMKFVGDPFEFAQEMVIDTDETLGGKQEDVDITGAGSSAIPFSELASDTQGLLSALQTVFGLNTFRENQKEVIQNLVSGKSTLMLMKAGHGKSLCYQLPMYLLRDGFDLAALVISPLISLMNDQFVRLPKEIQDMAFVISSENRNAEADAVKRLQRGEIKLLFVSPERFTRHSFQTFLFGLRVGIICIDEIHCVSLWSHNFRPSYLKIAESIGNMSVHAVLGLTATATPNVLEEINSRFDFKQIYETSSTTAKHINANLQLASLHLTEYEQKQRQLVKLLKESVKKGQTIIYCQYRAEVERVVENLRIYGVESVGYHSGMKKWDKEKAENKFRSGAAKILVSTEAFGLGIDIGGVSNVVHHTMPSSIERYTQEIGRAGRDGRSGACVVLVCKSDFERLHSLAYSDFFENERANVLCSCILDTYSKLRPREKIPGLEPMQSQSHSHMRIHDINMAETAGEPAIQTYLTLSVEESERMLDCKKEVMETLLTLLECQTEGKLVFECRMKVCFTLYFFSAPADTIAGYDAIIHAILASIERLNDVSGMSQIFDEKSIHPLPNSKKKGSRTNGKGGNTKKRGKRRTKKAPRNVRSDNGGEISFDLADVLNETGYQPAHVYSHLNQLQKEGILRVEATEDSFLLRLNGNVTGAYLAEAAARAVSSMAEVEKRKVEQLMRLYDVLVSVATSSLEGKGGSPPNPKTRREALFSNSRRFKALIQRYFEDSLVEGAQKGDASRYPSAFKLKEMDEVYLKKDLKEFLDSVSTPKDKGLGKGLTPRNIARIFHGIDSPNFPRIEWKTNRFWGQYFHIPFPIVLQHAEAFLAAPENSSQDDSFE